MKKITLSEEISNIKRLYKFKKGDTMLLEENCKKDDPKNLPLCSDLIEDIENKLIRGPFTEKKFYTVTLDNGCSKKCLKEKTESSIDTNAGEIQKYLIEKGAKIYEHTALQSITTNKEGTISGLNINNKIYVFVKTELLKRVACHKNSIDRVRRKPPVD